MKPLVSIITPSYNQDRFIRETIESVLSQDYDNIEYIIIDGCSTDNSLNIIKEYENQLKYVSQKDQGQSDAINKGFKMAHGEIIAWLNSDDIYEPNCISAVVEEFSRNQTLGLLYGDGYIIDENSNKIKIFEATQEFDFWKLVNYWDYIMQPTAFFRREVLKQVNFLDTNLHYCMDWDLWIRMAAVSEVKYIPQLLACSREYSNTKTSTGGDRRLAEIVGLLQKYSGKKKPLGVASYKASTFYMKHANDIWFIRKCAALYLVYKHKWLNKQIPLRYEDGWIGKKYAIAVPGYVRRVILEIELTLSKVIPQTINIYVNQRIRSIETYEKLGCKEIIIDLPSKNIMNEITIICNKTCIDGGADKRILSVKILDITFLESA